MYLFIIYNNFSFFILSHIYNNKNSKMKYVSRFDYLSHHAKLTINSKGDTKFQTVFGGVLSVISIISSFVISTILFIQYIRKDSSHLTVSSESSFFYNFSYSHQTPFMMRLLDMNLKPYENPSNVYYIKMRYWYGGNNQSDNEFLSSNEIPIEPCDINKHFSFYKHMLGASNDLSSYFCPRERQFNQTIKGVYRNSSPFGYYHFYLYKNANNTNASLLLQSAILDFKYIDYDISTVDRHRKKKPSLRTENFLFSSNQYKKIWIYLRHIKYVSDEGLVFTHKNTEEVYQVDSVRFDSVNAKEPIEDSDNIFGGIAIIGKSRGDIYYIKYIKFQEYIANISGMIRFIFTISYVVNYCYSRNCYYLMIINSFFNNKKSKNLIMLKERNSLVNSCTVNNFIEQKNRLINIKIQEKNNAKCDTNVNYKIRINIMKRFVPFKLIFSKKKFQVIHEYYHEINRRLSIFSLLKYQDEFNVLMKMNHIGNSFDNSNEFISKKAEKEKCSKDFSFQKKINNSSEKLET